MPKTELLVRLRELHEELSSINDDLKSAEQVDEASIDALGQLVTDVSELVDQAREVNSPEVAVAEHHDLVDRISQFETHHPRVTGFLSQVTDLLAMMGI
jgi:predicted nuclease with TOPRIM domain